MPAPHPLADASAECGGPASCDVCATGLWREMAAPGREIDGGSMPFGEVVAAPGYCNEAKS